MTLEAYKDDSRETVSNQNGKENRVVTSPEIPPTIPTVVPSTVAPSGKRNRLSWGTVVSVGLIALGGGVAFGALGPGFGWGDSIAPSPSPSATTPTASPTPSVETTRFNIPEGFTTTRIYERGEEVLGIPVEDFEAAAAEPDLIGLPPEANGSVEGWLGAFTYWIPETATAADVMAEMIDGTLMHLDARGIAPEDRLDVLTKASLIEKEVSRDEDRPKVARVIENRLAADMKLKFDSTVHYVVGATSAYTSDEDRAVDSPYNTYLYKGLPIGPICSPGLPSIDAVLNPADGTMLYFVAINLDTGETAFATTPEEHEANVELLRAWEHEN